jgi:hypothetical protein
LNEAREAAEWKCRALGFENDATADGVYIVTVQTEMLAQPL